MPMIKMLKDKIKQKLISEYKHLFADDVIEEKKLKGAIDQILKEIIEREHIRLSGEDKNTIVVELVNELFGFGPLEELIRDPSITEIMINGPKKIYVESDGKKRLSNITFENEQQLMHLVHRILAPTRRHVDESHPYTEISLKDGLRVNIVIPPLALDGTIITVRKFSDKIKSAEDLMALGTLNRRMADFLIACIKAKINIIFSGATGVGKTTTLNVLSSYIPDEDRVITIEDTAELRLRQDHVVRLEARQASVEGKGEITIRDLFKNSLRMRPDRIIIGEIRGQEALDMLQAICSGHRGSLVVLHADSPRDVLYRLETMILTSAVPINLETIHRQIATSVNLIVQHEHLLDGSRKIVSITQINGLKEGDVVLEDIFVYSFEFDNSENKYKNKWLATGVIPAFYPLFKKAGVDLPIEIFNKD